MYIERTQLRVVATGSCQAPSDSLSSIRGTYSCGACYALCLLRSLHPPCVRESFVERPVFARTAVCGIPGPRCSRHGPPFVAVAVARISGGANHPPTEGTVTCPIICKELC